MNVRQLLDHLGYDAHADHDATIRDALIRLIRAERERDAWRWLHWGHHDASWACPCGHAYGGGEVYCEECDTWRPMQDALLVHVKAGTPYTADLVAIHRTGRLPTAP